MVMDRAGRRWRRGRGCSNRRTRREFVVRSERGERYYHRRTNDRNRTSKMKLLLVILLPVSLCAQSGLDRPRVGQILDEHGSLRPVFGVGGSFTTNAPFEGRVLSTACSRSLCLVKTDSAILSGSSVTAAPPGPAVIGLDGATAWIYFSESKQFSYWQAGTLSPLDWSVDGEVLSLQAALRLAVRRDSGVWIISSDGTILDSLPPEAGPVLLIEGGAVVYATPDSVVLRKSGGAEIRFSAPGVDALFQMGAGYVEARSGTAIYALRTAAGIERLFLLPGSSKK